jgi:hypothetical protein
MSNPATDNDVPCEGCGNAVDDYGSVCTSCMKQQMRDWGELVDDEPSDTGRTAEGAYAQEMAAEILSGAVPIPPIVPYALLYDPAFGA